MRRRLAAERGAVIPFVALTISLIVIGASFSVDLGALTNTTRNLQKVADLAAIDAAWVLDGSNTETIEPAVMAAAQESAERNGFGDIDDETLGVAVGRWDTTTHQFTETGPSEVPNAVQVTAAAVHNYFLRPGTNHPVRSSVAARQESPGEPTEEPPTDPPPSGSESGVAGFMAGSRLASLDSSQATLLNDVFTAAFGDGESPPEVGYTVNLTAVDYNNVAGAAVTLEELGAALGMSAGTPNEVLDATLAVDDFLAATASVVNSRGETAAADVIAGIATGAAGTSFQLGSVIAMAPGGEGAAYSTDLDVLGLLTATAFVADGDSFITLPSLTASIPGVTGLTAGLRVLEQPRWAFGPVGTTLHTSQVDLDLTADVDIDLSSVAPSLRATGTVPLEVDLVSLDVTLQNMVCPADATDPGTADLLADPNTAEAATSGDFTVVEEVAGIPTSVAQANLGGALSIDTTAEEILGLHPVETYTFGSDTVGLASMDVDVISATVTGPLTVSMTAVTDGLADALAGILGELDTGAIKPVAESLGMRFTGGDVTLDSVACTSTSTDDPPAGGGTSSSPVTLGGIPEIVS